MSKRTIKRITVEYYIGGDDVFTNDNHTQGDGILNKTHVPKNHVISDFVVNYVPGKNIHIKSDEEVN